MPGGGGWGCQSYELSGTEGPTNFGRINWVMSNYVSVQKKRRRREKYNSERQHELAKKPVNRYRLKLRLCRFLRQFEFVFATLATLHLLGVPLGAKRTKELSKEAFRKVALTG